MALPTRATVEDLQVVCKYLVTKPTGSALKEMKSVVDKKHLRGEKIAALKFWGLIDDQEGKLKVTSKGRKCTKGPREMGEVLRKIIRDIKPYSAIIERAAHRKEDSLTALDVAAHWHEHFSSEAADSDKALNAQAVCFFQVADADGAGLGNVIIGRKGAPTRISFSIESLKKYIGEASTDSPQDDISEEVIQTSEPETEREETISDLQGANVDKSIYQKQELGQGIFIAHGKNKKPLKQLKNILEQFKIPYKVAIDEPNLGRPISGKVREIMELCNCAILIFTADEEFQDKKGNSIWRPSENVVFELGATGYLYDNRIVIMKEEGVTFPSNFSDIGYISFEKDKLDAKALDVLKELIGFGIVKVST